MIDASNISGRIGVTAGRVTTFDFGSPVSAVVATPQSGNATINPDGTVALVLADEDQRGDASFWVEIDRANGEIETVEVPIRAKAGPQKGGWGEGDHYTLAVDGNDDTVVEPGENHRKIHVSESDAALDRADIAAREGIAEGRINARWLEDHPEYGSTEALALDTDLGISLWNRTTGRESDPSSNWLLFESGYEYEDTGRIINRGSEGESALHPIFVGAWGNGDKPVFGDTLHIFQEQSSNIVVQGLEFERIRALNGVNLMFDDLTVRGEVIVQGYGTVIEGATIRNSMIVDASNGGRISGVYAAGIDGLLIEKTLADHNGWQEGYETGDGQAPTMVNHNFYIQYGNEDVTFRDNVSMRASSFGAQFRSGAVIENNAFIDNNAAFNTSGGAYGGRGHLDNYSLILDNIVTSAGYKIIPGAIDWGIHDYAHWSSYIGNIIAHLADPADPAERDEKATAPHNPHEIRLGDAVTDDTIIYNWISDAYREANRFDTDQNLPDIAPAQLDEVTVRRFVEKELGIHDLDDPIDVLATFLRDQWGKIGASDIVDFFQEGFGIDTSVTATSQTLRFVPDERGEGFRWDNRLNWTDEERPQDGDRVELAGNWVTYAGTNTLKSVDLGAGGQLTVRQGLLEVSDLRGGAGSGIEIGRAGQFWTDGYDGDSRIAATIEGGRFANTGRVDGGLDLSVSGGETIFATGGASFTADGRIEIGGSDAKIGFDGQGGRTAALSFADTATLSFTGDRGGFSAIGEFRSGAWDVRETNVVSSVDLGSADASLRVDIGGITTGARLDLIDVDRLVGGFGTIEVEGGSGASFWMDYGEDRLQVARGGDDLHLIGSSDADVFVLAEGREIFIEGYGANDSLDLSAILEDQQIAGLQLDSHGGRTDLLDAAGVKIAEFDSEVDTIKVAKGGSSAPVSEPDLPPSPVPNAAPVAESLSFEGQAGKGLNGRLSASDADGDDLTFSLLENTESGSVRIDPNGRFVFDGQGDFDDLPNGQTENVSFTYTVSDGRGGVATSTVDLEISGVADHWNVISGSNGNDDIKGTDGSDVIRTGGGRLDRSWGGDGGDVFVFGADARNGTQAIDFIYDFDASEDSIVIEQGAKAMSMAMHGDTYWITLRGDGDTIAIRGEGLEEDSVAIDYHHDHWLA